MKPNKNERWNPPTYRMRAGSWIFSRENITIATFSPTDLPRYPGGLGIVNFLCENKNFFPTLIESRSTARWILESPALFISRLVDAIEIFLSHPLCSRSLLIQDVHTRAATVSLKAWVHSALNLRRRDFDAIKLSLSLPLSTLASQ